jgi:Mrp family chromosome partitioning ATPase
MAKAIHISKKKKGASLSEREAAMALQDQLIKDSLSLVKHKFIVMSGKGGVGKTSVAANLAMALARQGARVGLMDIDLHGPDIPRILGLKGVLEASVDGKINPKPYSENLEVISVGSMAGDPDKAVIWRGPLKLQVIRKFISGVHWGKLDYLIIDSPPGTGDEPLTVAQTISDAKAIIVTMPQEMSLGDVRKSINFCETVKMEVFGLIENMSGLVCPHCGKPIDLFGTGGGFRTATDMNIPFLGRIPLDPKMVKCADMGEPYMVEYPDSEVTKAFNQIVDRILEKGEAKTAVA